MLYQYNLNGILADEMGLGKTLQVIALLDSIQDPDKHTLIVCPASLIYNWEDEIHRFSESLPASVLPAPKKNVKKDCMIVQNTTFSSHLMTICAEISMNIRISRLNT